MRPKKSLGQHFLKDKGIAQRIVQSLSPSSVNVLEVGPGTGALTGFLLQRPDTNLYAVEVDGESIVHLNQYYPQLIPHLINDDFLELDLSKVFNGELFSAIGNFPYNISSQIFFKVIKYKDKIPEVVGMVQKEVAERMVAAHGNKTYGILSVLLQRWYNIEYLFTVHENVFVPPPKVKSAVVRLTRNQTMEMDCNEALFVKVVKTTFNQRRKTIRNSLKPLLEDKTLEHEFMVMRPEQLSIAQFAELTRCVEQVMKE
jgi:16S rRNA (adenine1518-N6/adenine1519-N6)-dimethyltransferase